LVCRPRPRRRPRPRELCGLRLPLRHHRGIAPEPPNSWERGWSVVPRILPTVGSGRDPREPAERSPRRMVRVRRREDHMSRLRGRIRRTRGCPVLAAVAAPVVVAALAAPAGACGGLVGENGTIQLTRTTTLAAYHDGVERYVTSFEFSGQGKEVGSIVPLPAIPTKVERGGSWTLQRLE